MSIKQALSLLYMCFYMMITKSVKKQKSSGTLLADK